METGASRSAGDRVGYHVIRTAMRIRQSYVEAIAEADLLPNQHAVLVVLAAGPTYQRQLADQATVNAGDLVGYLDALESRGYVTRERDPNDRRRHRVAITDAGRRQMALADTHIDDAERALFGHLGADDRARLVRLLDDVATRMGGAGRQHG